jgi:hypothetical protein
MELTEVEELMMPVGTIIGWDTSEGAPFIDWRTIRAMANNRFSLFLFP